MKIFVKWTDGETSAYNNKEEAIHDILGIFFNTNENLVDDVWGCDECEEECICGNEIALRLSWTVDIKDVTT